MRSHFKTDEQPPETSADGDDPAPGHIAESKVDSRSPLIYVCLLDKKSHAADDTILLMTRVRDDLGHLPHSMPHHLHSDIRGEFVCHKLQEYCNLHGIRKTRTDGYDPAASDAGESAVGFVKRKSRQLHVGSGLETRW